jgi:hypothetical protein
MSIFGSRDDDREESGSDAGSPDHYASDVSTAVSDRVRRKRLARHFRRKERGTPPGPDLEAFDDFEYKDLYVVMSPENPDEWVASQPRELTP